MFHKFNNVIVNILFFVNLVTQAVKKNRKHQERRYKMPWRGLWALAMADEVDSSQWCILAPDGSPFDFDEGWTRIGVVENGKIIPLTLFGFGCLLGDGTPETATWEDDHYHWVVETTGGHVPLPLIEGLMW